jgi:hypothetical protein
MTGALLRSAARQGNRRARRAALALDWPARRFWEVTREWETGGYVACDCVNEREVAMDRNRMIVIGIAVVLVILLAYLMSAFNGTWVPR